MIDIEKSFENRWRIYGCDDSVEGNDKVKEYARKFFEAGIMLNQIDDEVEITSEDFEFWWLSYNKKVGKEKCKKLWAKMSNADKKLCVQYTPAYVAATSDKQYRKNPETFLRNKCWNDELIYHDNGNKPDNDLTKLGKILAP